MLDIGNSGAVLEMGEVQTAARTLGVERFTLEIRRAEDIAPAFETLKGRAEVPSGMWLEFARRNLQRCEAI